MNPMMAPPDLSKPEVLVIAQTRTNNGSRVSTIKLPWANSWNDHEYETAIFPPSTSIFSPAGFDDVVTYPDYSAALSAHEHAVRVNGGPMYGQSTKPLVDSNHPSVRLRSIRGGFGHLKKGLVFKDIEDSIKVQKGDTLSSIARKLTGDASDWKMLQIINRIKNPDLILPGQILSTKGLVRVQQ